MAYLARSFVLILQKNLGQHSAFTVPFGRNPGACWPPNLGVRWALLLVFWGCMKHFLGIASVPFWGMIVVNLDRGEP